MSDNVPSDVLAEILCRLPVKSLLCCQTVSKRWHSIISDPGFITTHSNHSINKFIVLSTPVACTFCCLQPSNNASDSHKVLAVWEDSIPFDMSYVQTRVKSVGSCNGLLCIKLSLPFAPNLLFLYNPSTRKWFGIRANDSSFYPRYMPIYRSIYGLGFDSVNNDYKVLEVLTARCFVNSGAFLFSVKSNSWNYVGDFPYRLAGENELCAWVDGSFHFIGRKTKNDSVESLERIIALNPANNKTHLVQFFEDIEIKPKASRLAVLSECLCVVYNCSSDQRYNLWMMKEYGVKSSWTVLASIPYSSSIDSHGIFPILVMEDGELLVSMNGSDLRLYNPQLNTTRHVILDEVKNIYAVSVYKETLVSPTVKTPKLQTDPPEEKKVEKKSLPVLASLPVRLLVSLFLFIFLLMPLCVTVIKLYHCRNAGCFLGHLTLLILCVFMFTLPARILQKCG